MAGREEWSVEEIVSTLNDTARTDKDNQISIDGATGSGKSTLGIKLCKKGCPWFDMQRDVLYSRREIIEWISNARPGSWGLADEVVNALFKRDFATKDQKFLLRLLDMCRDRNLTLIMCIPNFWALDKHLLDGRLRLRIHVAKTGFAFMWKPSTNPFAPDRWYRKLNEKICYNWDSYPNARKTKGFLGYLKFGDLGVKDKAEYLEIKERKKRMIAELESREEKASDLAKKRSVELGKTMMLNILSERGLLKIGAINAVAEVEGVDHSTITARMKALRERLESIRGDVSTVEYNKVYNSSLKEDDFKPNRKDEEHRAI